MKPAHIDFDMNAVPLPTAMDIKKAEVAALSCRSIKQIAEFVQEDILLVKSWMRRSPAYAKAVSSWQMEATFEIKKALAKKALGFTKKTKKQVVTRTGQVETLESETYYPPDTAAIQFWLKNRDGVEWKDTQQIDLNVTANIRAWLVDVAATDPDILNITPINNNNEQLTIVNNTNVEMPLLNEEIERTIIEVEMPLSNQKLSQWNSEVSKTTYDNLETVEPDFPPPWLEPQKDAPLNPAPLRRGDGMGNLFDQD